MADLVRTRLAALLAEMGREGIDFYLIPTGDFHQSEYVSPYFRVREYFSGFTGSNGTLLVSRQETCLWTDGRYFIQAKRELAGTGIVLQRSGEEGVPTLMEYLKARMLPGQTLGFDGRVVSASLGRRLEKELAALGISLKYDSDLASGIWTDRPALPNGPIRILPAELCGKNVGEKLGEVRGKLCSAGASSLLLASLDDIMWLFNIRGCDVASNPVALSYCFLTQEECWLFLQPAAMNDELAAYLEGWHVALKPYHEITEFLSHYRYEGIVSYDEGSLSFLLYRLLTDRADCVEGENPTRVLKAVKNETELANIREAYRQDSAALCRFIYWIKKTVGRQELDEFTAGQYLDHLRSELPGFLDLSFPTICAYRENAAMMHYQAPEQGSKRLAPCGILLVDSGGQYLGGTTDVTRSIALGEVDEEQKKHFTLIAVGLLRLSNARFLHGCTGRNLDILARGPLWDIGMDYKCGTGHGIGYILNVHEDPPRISYQAAEGMLDSVLEPGMIVSDEPGVYVEGSHGIRTENILCVREAERNSDGRFLAFDTLTLVPIDLDAIDVAYLQPADIGRLNAYHEMVYAKIHPLLDHDEAVWLKDATRPVGT